MPIEKQVKSDELKEWLNEFTGPVVLLCRDKIKSIWQNKLSEVGIPAERIQIPDKADDYEPTGTELMIVTDDSYGHKAEHHKAVFGDKPALYVAIVGNHKVGKPEDGQIFMDINMNTQNIAGIIIEGLVPILESRLPNPMEAAKATLTEQEDPVRIVQEFIGEGKVLMNCYLFSSEFDAADSINYCYRGGLAPREKIVVQRRPEKALELLTTTPRNFAIVVSDNPDLLTRIRNDTKLSHILRIYQSPGRYIDDVPEREYLGLGVHGVLAEHSYQEEQTLAKTLLDAIATMRKGETITTKVTRWRYV